MNYMILVYRNESLDMDARARKGCDGLDEQLIETGQYLAGGILQPTSCATSVKVRNGRRVVTDGPFAETREQLAGYMLVEAKDLDEAISIASQHPVATIGTVEVRPLRFSRVLAREGSESGTPCSTITTGEANDRN